MFDLSEASALSEYIPSIIVWKTSCLLQCFPSGGCGCHYVVTLLNKLGLLLINIFVLIMHSHTKGVTVWQLSSILCDIWRPENAIKEMSKFGSVCSLEIFSALCYCQFLFGTLADTYDTHLVLCFLFSFLDRNQSPNPDHPSRRQPGRVTILGCP